jgi:hypothetical protein
MCAATLESTSRGSRMWHGDDHWDADADPCTRRCPTVGRPVCDDGSPRLRLLTCKSRRLFTWRCAASPTPGGGSSVDEGPAAQSLRIRRQYAVGSVRDVHLTDLTGLAEVDVDMKWVLTIRWELVSVWQFDVLLAPIGCQQNALAASDNAEVNVVRGDGRPRDHDADRSQRYPHDDTTHTNPPLDVDQSEWASLPRKRDGTVRTLSLPNDGTV